MPTRYCTSYLPRASPRNCTVCCRHPGYCPRPRLFSLKSSNRTAITSQKTQLTKKRLAIHTQRHLKNTKINNHIIQGNTFIKRITEFNGQCQITDTKKNVFKQRTITRAHSTKFARKTKLFLFFLNASRKVCIYAHIAKMLCWD